MIRIAENRVNRYYECGRGCDHHRKEKYIRKYAYNGRQN